MKSFVFFLIAFLTFSNIAFSQQSQTLITIDGDKISKNEFLNIYNKNNNKDEPNTKESLNDYLELFINYKLKVKEAEALKLDTAKSFINELAGYRRQLAQPYLSNREVTDQLLTEAYQRSLSDIRASHILIKISENAAPEDTLKAYKKIIDIRKKIIDGAKFDDIAKKYSEDESAKNHLTNDGKTEIKGNAGDLGFFSVLNLFYEFENAAYNLNLGDISMPIRTPVGYHIIKITDKKTALGKVQVAHILVSENNDNKIAQQKIEEAYSKISKGEKFEDVATQYSDDRGSVAKGGVLPWIGSFRIAPEFVLPIYNMKIGDITKPIQTPYGWHIIKLLDKKTIGTFDEEKANLKNKIQRDKRTFIARDKLIDRLKKEYNVNVNQKVLDEIKPMLSDSLYSLTWRAPADNKSLTKIVLKIADNSYSLNEFAKYMTFRQSQIKKGDDLFVFAKNIFNQFEEDKIIEYENTQLENKYPEFKALMSEYRDGILLFELMDKNVWSKAVKDTNGLNEFYQSIKSKYMYGTRADATIFSCKDPETFSALNKTLKKAVKKNKSPESICNKFNKDSIPNITFQNIKVEKGNNELVDKTKWENKAVKDFSDKNKIVWIKNILEPEPKELIEVKGLVTAEYQNKLEQEWIKKLRNKYNVEINKDVLNSIYK